ncbi:hypothetical protein A4X13_0g7830 [Tilletia indica]|uniref:Uncharacterized protein n=1 Tax=Tilletia indica TaxID=43049 RepID=A0A8T8SHK1_9BASI|nr:hypothetical protein A4X13_0g7830 [Tilletia indica]
MSGSEQNFSPLLTPSSQPPLTTQPITTPSTQFNQTLLDSVNALHDLLGDLVHRVGVVEQTLQHAPTTTAPDPSTTARETNVGEHPPTTTLDQLPHTITREQLPTTTPAPLLSSTTRDQLATPAAEDKIVFRRVLDTLGTTTRNFFDEVGLGDEQMFSAPSVREDDQQDEQRSIFSSPVAAISRQAQNGSTIPSSMPTTTDALPWRFPPSRPLECKKDNLGEFWGRPDELEDFFLQVKDVLRSDDTNPAWEPAVVRALTLAMKGDAAVWHRGLSDPEAARMDTVAGWIEAMREHFPVNAAQLRRNARARRWRASQETSTAYYFHKLQMLRQAFGFDQPEPNLVTDIKEDLPATFRAMLRLPREGPTLRHLRLELAEWEHTWRELHNTPLLATTTATRTTQTSPVISQSIQSTTPTASRPSMVRSAPAPVRPAPGATSAPAPSSTAPVLVGLAATYDPSRVTPAANGRPRTYKRPDTDAIMTLNRACGKCGQDHFNFEHVHLSAPQVRVMAIEDDDYPEQEEEDVMASDSGIKLFTVASGSQGLEQEVEEGTQSMEVPTTSRGSGSAPSMYEMLPDDSRGTRRPNTKHIFVSTFVVIRSFETSAVPGG